MLAASGFRLAAGSRPTAASRRRSFTTNSVPAMKLSVDEQPAGEHQVKPSRQIRREPSTVAHDRQTEQQACEHEQEVQTAEREKENSATVVWNDIAFPKSPRGASEPGDDEDLRGDECRIGKNATVPRLKSWQQRRINYQRQRLCENSKDE